ncbi:MAG: molecular chaperone DnaK [Deltaproteobacteria bacterium]|nr:molecular chaperone DnaK [Deltaproteobacteria bacterium]
MGKAIGIDLGTTYSVAAIVENRRVHIIQNAEGDRLTPSVYAENADGRIMVGAIARNQASVNPNRTVSSVKRLMGSNARIPVNGRSLSPQEISAHILRKIKVDARRQLGEDISQAVITVPAYFSDAQRRATQEAGKMAGFEIMRIISEPTAAALAYGMNRSDIQHILVWDLGGGTFDVSILEVGDGLFHVRAVNGNTRLGGDDWDARLISHLKQQILHIHDLDIESNACAFQQVKEACERVKRELSVQNESHIFLPLTSGPHHDAIEIEMTISRDVFENLTQDLLNMLIPPTRQALEDAALTPADMDRVILVGGATRMPAVRYLVETLFQQSPDTHLNPDEVVAMGAAIQAGVLNGSVRDVILIDVTPLSLGIETQGGLFTRLISRNTTIPVSAERIFTNAEDNQTVMDFNVLQGEREMAGDNISLGSFELTDIPMLPRGKAHVEVMFEIDVNGILQVSAQELHTGESAGIKIDAVHLLSGDQIDQAVAEAAVHAETDIQRRREIETSIQTNRLIQAAETLLFGTVHRLSKASRREIHMAISAAKTALVSGQFEAMIQTAQGLTIVLNRL